MTNAIYVGIFLYLPSLSFVEKVYLQKERRTVVTKAQLVDVVSGNARISKAAAAKAIDSFINGVIKALKKGEKVTLVGFGTFSVTKKKARAGRNPQTGAEIKIPATKAPKFTAGKALKSAVK